MKAVLAVLNGLLKALLGAGAGFVLAHVPLVAVYLPAVAGAAGVAVSHVWAWVENEVKIADAKAKSEMAALKAELAALKAIVAPVPPAAPKA